MRFRAFHQISQNAGHHLNRDAEADEEVERLRGRPKQFTGVDRALEIQMRVPSGAVRVFSTSSTLAQN